MANYYRGVEQAPYHLSVGAVLRNERSEVACHHFARYKEFSDFYLLMRETLEPSETIEQALRRGLLEEFGAKARVVGYMGSLVVALDTDPVIQKTTLYFLCDLIDIRPEWRDPEDEEKDSVIEWHTPDFLIEKMVQQGAKYHKRDLDESAVLQRLAHFRSD